MKSIWSMTAGLPAFPPLEGELSTEVLVIGGGMAGLLTAWKLRDAGADCVLVEANTLCGGVTACTTAKVTAQHGLVYDKLLQRFGLEKARLYLTANLAALEEYARLCKTIDCGFERQDSFVYALQNRKLLDRELEVLRTLGYSEGAYAQSLPLPIKTAGAVRFRNQAQLHPLRLAAALAQGLPIYAHTPVRELGPGWAKTDHGVIRAKKIIVTTHFPILNKHGSYYLKLYQHRSYVLALENVPAPDGMYVDASNSGLSFRRWGELLLLGGGGHRTGKPGGSWKELETFAARNWPQARIRARWATQDCMTLDGVPYIGPYSNSAEGLYTATGFNKWGMTSSMTAAQVLTDLVTGKHSPWADLYSPSRTILRPQLAVNAWEAAVNLLTPTAHRCPHLGCALKWNGAEHTWDCPCHGSRFAQSGVLLEGPATGNLKNPAGR